jgi:hypothetical protein
MYISSAEICAKGVTGWSNAHAPYVNDNEGDVARLDALALIGVEYAAMTSFEEPLRSRLVPGMRNTL